MTELPDPSNADAGPSPPTPGKREPAERWGIYVVDLGNGVGSEMAKARPCVVLSADEMNRQMHTAIVAPMTTTRIRHPSRVPVRFEKQKGDIVLHQIRTVDQSRFGKRLGTLDEPSAKQVLEVLRAMFS